MPKYRNTRTGRVVNVPESAPTRTDRPKRDKQWSEHLRRLTRSKRWERVSDSTKAGMPKSRPKRRKVTTVASMSAESAQNEQTGDQGDGSQDS